MKKLRIAIITLIAIVVGFVIVPHIAVAESAEQDVYVGGFPIGISVDIGGLLVENVTGVETEYGFAVVDGICAGDIIKKIDGIEVNSADDISEMLSPSAAELEILRHGETIVVKVVPIIEAYTQKPRLGIKIKDVVYGIGTVTFVCADGRYAALGHEIESDFGESIPFSGGHIHACRIVGVKRGTKGEAGALLASLLPDKVFGTVTCNNGFGVAGVFTADFDTCERMKIANRDDVHPGAAKIRTTISGAPEYFDIEIIKAVKQTGRKEKGMIIRVTDKRLLDVTGGVVRGMSGSPIIQDGKLVGAVTHVFLNDYTKGYGVYADCLN